MTSSIRSIPTGPGTGRLLPCWPGESVPETIWPPVANVSYACAMSSGVTPSLRPPSDIARFVETFVRMPIRRASRATLRVLTCRATWAYTELSENVVALASVVTPAYASS